MIPQHHGQDMSVVDSRLKCRVCGFEMPNPRETGFTVQRPVHCGKPMVLVRDLKCDVCGFEQTDIVQFDDVAAEGPSPPPAAPPRRRARSAGRPVEVTGLVGQTWGPYRIVDELGRGGMAIVYKAYQPSLERYVAIKLLLPQITSDSTVLERFTQEARLIAKLRHPNIVTVLDFGEKRAVAYLVMEYVDGQTLKAALGQPMALDQALTVAGQVGRALDYAHHQGVIHRDVKPSNILLAREDWALLSDFGIAKALESPQQFTMTGVGLGTPEYMAPEQGQGLEVDARADIYGLGVVLYEMLTGRPPFAGDTPLSVMLKHVNDPLPPPRSVNPDIPVAAEQIVVKATAKQPAERYASAREMVAALDALHGTQEAPSAPSPTAQTLIEEPPGKKPLRRWWPF